MKDLSASDKTRKVRSKVISQGHAQDPASLTQYGLGGLRQGHPQQREEDEHPGDGYQRFPFMYFGRCVLVKVFRSQVMRPPQSCTDTTGASVRLTI